MKVRRCHGNLTLTPMRGLVRRCHGNQLCSAPTGSDYNIPVCVWIHQTHPASRPRCYVCPSVSMVINPHCPCVDATGNVTVETLRTWTQVSPPGSAPTKPLLGAEPHVDDATSCQGVSDLSLLLSDMRRVFQLDTPLYARCPAQATPPADR